jgi:hypothetical protein
MAQATSAFRGALLMYARCTGLGANMGDERYMRLTDDQSGDFGLHCDALEDTVPPQELVAPQAYTCLHIDLPNEPHPTVPYYLGYVGSETACPDCGHVGTLVPLGL